MLICYVWIELHIRFFLELYRGEGTFFSFQARVKELKNKIHIKMRLSCADTHNGSDNETASGSIRGKERGKKNCHWRTERREITDWFWLDQQQHRDSGIHPFPAVVNILHHEYICSCPCWWFINLLKKKNRTVQKIKGNDQRSRMSLNEMVYWWFIYPFNGWPNKSFFF